MAFPSRQPVSKNNKVIPHPANAPVQAGDIITSDAGTGWWVVLKDHVTGGGPTPAGLKPGQSNDLYHWATP